MATLYQHYNTGHDDEHSCHGNECYAQIFTPAVPQKITLVKLLLFKYSTPATVTISIRATENVDGLWIPTGPDLTSVSFDGNTLPWPPPSWWIGYGIDPAFWPPDLPADWEWVEKALTAYSLAPDTPYAIVVIESANLNIWAGWRVDKTAPTYTRGNAASSMDGGASWAPIAEDFMFEEWGDPIIPLTINKAYALAREEL